MSDEIIDLAAEQYEVSEPEPDHQLFRTEAGYFGMVLRNGELGTLCGYVILPLIR